MRKLFLFALLPILLLVIVPTAFAANNLKSDKIVTVAKDEVIEGNFYAGGEIIEIFGTIEGDAYVAGGQVTIDGVINGDLLTAGGLVNISGVVNGDVRAAGGQLNINADIERNLTLAGGNIDISDTSNIGRALHLIGGNLITGAPVAEETLVAGGNLVYRGSTGKDLEAKVGTLRLAPGSEISGDFNYWASDEAFIDDGAIVGGTTTQHEISNEFKSPDPESIKAFSSGFSLFAKLTSIITTLIIGLILIKLFPNCASAAIKVVRTRTMGSIGIGILALILAPIIFILLLITGVGMPLAFIFLPLFIIFSYYARVYAILALGQILNQKISKKVTPFMSLVLGIVIYYALSYIPVIGALTALTVFLVGIGAGLISAKKLYRSAREKKVF